MHFLTSSYLNVQSASICIVLTELQVALVRQLSWSRTSKTLHFVRPK